MAVTCSGLSRVLPATFSTVAVHCTQLETFDSYAFWLEQHSMSLQRVTQCIVQAYKYSCKHVNARDGKFIPCPLYSTPFRHLPCPQLRQLHIGRLKLQLEQAGSYPGVLGSCTRLTALDLQQCELQDISAGIRAIAALPELQYLSLSLTKPYTGSFCFVELKQASQLTHLGLAYDSEEGGQHIQQLDEVSTLVNLRHLALHGLPASGIPGGLPSQLVKLTCLDVHYKGASTADQFQHLSCLTALQDLSVQSECSKSSEGFVASALTGMQHLKQLTCLELLSYALDFSITSTCKWACLTALEKLVLWECEVQQEALAGLTKLRALYLTSVRVHSQGITSHALRLEGLLAAISKLQLLTELRLNQDDTSVIGWTGRCPQTDAFTALTASTNLCCLQLSLESMKVPQGEYVLFRPGVVYPRLRRIALQSDIGWGCTVDILAERQLPRLCSCCPALESLALTSHVPIAPSPSAAYWQPLLQLSVLTHLEVNGLRAPAAGLVGIVAQLTRLRQLKLAQLELQQLTDPIMLQLTALIALEQLSLRTYHVIPPLDMKAWKFCNKAHGGNSSDVWMQLLSRIVGDTVFVCNPPWGYNG